MSTLEQFGWTPAHQEAWDALALPGLSPARVVADFGTSLKIATPSIVGAELSGKLAHYTDREQTPKVGDWVAVRLSENNLSTIESVVLRANEIARKVAGKQTTKQIVAANVDIAFVLLALDKDFSVERLKRFLFQLSVHNVEAVIVLNKADKTDDLQGFTDQITQLNIPVIIATATEGIGVTQIADRILPAKTAILLGSSGVGKSTLTNALLGREAQQTNTTRESDDTGRHTTVHRELFILPNGGILVDTPGIRELQLWGTEEDLDADYDDIMTLASQCEYHNCNHDNQEGCAIARALTDGTLDEQHYANYLKMKAELTTLTSKREGKVKQLNARPRTYAKTRSAKKHDAFADENY